MGRPPWKACFPSNPLAMNCISRMMVPPRTRVIMIAEVMSMVPTMRPVMAIARTARISARLGWKRVARQEIAAKILRSMPAPIRVLTAVPICDGHDSAINTINLEFIRHGIEVVYLGYHRYAEDIVRAAIQEDVRAIGISSYNGGHVEFFAEVVRQLKKRGAADIKVFGGGGGTITHDDQRVMQKRGVDKIFFAGTSLTDMTQWVRDRYGKAGKRGAGIVGRDETRAPS